MGLPRCKQIRQGTDLVNLSAEHLQAHACNIGRNRAIYIVVKRDGDALRRRPFAHASTCPHQCLRIARLPCANVSVMDLLGETKCLTSPSASICANNSGAGSMGEWHHKPPSASRTTAMRVLNGILTPSGNAMQIFAAVGNPDVLIEGFEGVQRVVEMDGGLGVFFSGCVIFKIPNQK